MAQLIDDEFSRIGTKETRYYLRQKSKGLCPHCGGPVAIGKTYCSTALANRAAAARRRYHKKKLQKPTIDGRKLRSKYYTYDKNGNRTLKV